MDTDIALTTESTHEPVCVSLKYFNAPHKFMCTSNLQWCKSLLHSQNCIDETVKVQRFYGNTRVCVVHRVLFHLGIKNAITKILIIFSLSCPDL